jgi:hypothetical protein
MTAMVAVVEPPCPPGAPPLPVPPAAPYAATVTFVAPAGTTKLCDAPVYPSVTVPVHLPEPHEHIPPSAGQLDAQLEHTPPVPHAVVLVPATQVPSVAAEQQPPLHACVEEQLVVHACVVVLHACPTAQSLGELQHLASVGQPVVPSFVPSVPVMASPPVRASPPSGEVVASSKPPSSPARMGSPMPAIAAHPAQVRPKARTVGVAARGTAPTT